MIEVALFGAGRIGKIHGGNVVRQPGVHLKYVVDVNADAARALAQDAGASVADVATAMGDPAIKAVVIASSTDTHADLIMRAAQAGKAIFCEKPGRPRPRACAHLRRRRAARRRALPDRLPAALRPDVRRRSSSASTTARSASPRCSSRRAAIRARRRSTTSRCPAASTRTC
jgi:hypothetical protein